MNRWEDFQSFEIAGRRVGSGCPAMIVAEVAQAHDGSLGMAHAFIDAVATRGVDAIKFQTHIADAESTIDEPFRVNFSLQDKTRYEYWRRMEFSAEQWSELATHARQRGIIFLSSPFSLPAVELLKRIGMPAWKIGSGEFGSRDLMDAMVRTGAPILFSTGMAAWNEIEDAAAWFKSAKIPFALLQCTSKYPTPLEEVGLNVIARMRNEFVCPVGLSDHSGSMLPGLAAIAQGADILEVHVTFDRSVFGPDVSSSITFDELATLCSMRDALAIMNTRPVDKDKMAADLHSMRKMFGKSLAPARRLASGTSLTADMLVPKKPGDGITPADLPKIIGRRLARDVVPERILRWEDLLGDPE